MIAGAPAWALLATDLHDLANSLRIETGALAAGLVPRGCGGMRRAQRIGTRRHLDGWRVLGRTRFAHVLWGRSAVPRRRRIGRTGRPSTGGMLPPSRWHRSRRFRVGIAVENRRDLVALPRALRFRSAYDRRRPRDLGLRALPPPLRDGVQ